MNKHDEKTTTRSVDLIDLLGRHWLKIGLGSILGLTLALVYCAATPPIHESSTEILIMSKDPGLASQAGSKDAVGFESAMENEILATHLHILRSPAIVRRAIESDELTELPSIRHELDDKVLAGGDVDSIRRAADNYIRSNLEVERGGSAETRGAQVLKVSFRHPSAEDGSKVLASIVSSYQGYVKEIVKDFGGEAVSLIRRARTDLESQVQDYDRQYSEFVRKSPLAHSAQTGEVSNPHAVRLSELQAELSRLEIEATKAEARLWQVEKILTKGDVVVDDLSMIDANDVPRLNLLIDVERNAPTAPIAAEYARLRQLETDALALEMRLGANHPKVKQQRAQIDAFKQASGTMAAIETIKEDEGVDPQRIAKGYVELLKNDLGDYKSSIEAVTAQIEKERDAARVLVETELQQRRYFKQLERAESAYDVVISRIEQLDLQNNYAGFTNRVLKPVEPGPKVWPSIPLLGLCGALLGGLLGGLFALCSEVFDKSYRNRADVEQALSVPVLCHLSTVRRRSGSGDSRIESSVFAWHQPNSPQSEAIRKLRGTVLYRTNEIDRPMIHVTSPGKAEGKSLLAANLAVSLSQSRRRVLVIDCNLRSPQIARLFGVTSANGVAEVLAGSSSVQDAIKETAVPGLAVVTCGSQGNPAELFTTTEFRLFLREASEQFDYVIIDSPGVLEFSEATSLADAADATILTMKLNAGSRTGSKEALNTLRNHGCNVLGVVVNDSQGASYQDEADSHDQPALALMGAGR